MLQELKNGAGYFRYRRTVYSATACRPFRHSSTMAEVTDGGSTGPNQGEILVG